MNRFVGWIRVGLLDLRSDLRRFGVLIACLALGTGVIAAVGSVGTSLRMAVERDATTLMGGDIEAARPDRDASPAELAFLKSLGQLAHVVDTNARASAGEEAAFVDLLAVDDAYPLLGQVRSPQLRDGERPGQLLGPADGAFGALIDPVLFDRLAIAPGDRFMIGDTEFEVRGTLTSLPDAALRGFKLGLTTVISTEALSTLGDLRAPLPGLLTQHRYKIVLDGSSYDQAQAAIAGQFADPGWITRSPRDAVGSLIRYYDLFLRFLLIVGLSSLLVGGVGVYNGVSAYIAERQQSIAILRSLGATGARVLTHFLAQIGVLTAIGVGLGLLGGAAASLLAVPLVGQALNVNLPPSLQPAPLLTAAAFGAVSGFLFSYFPLARARATSPAMLFRSLGSAVLPVALRDLLRPAVILPALLAAAAMFALAVATTGDLMLVVACVIGGAATFALLRVSGWLLQGLLKRLPRSASPTIRGALRNIYRPGSPAPTVVVSIGLGLSVLLIIILLQSNLTSQLLGVVSRDAPTFVATDLFEDEVETIASLSEGGDLERIETSPMLRAAVLGINGAPPDRMAELGDDATFLLSGEIPVTRASEKPRATELTEGEWWPASYAGEQLVSLRDTLRTELGLALGDRIEFSLFGDTFEARVASFQRYELRNGVDFMVTFSPGPIDAYPSTFMGSIKARPGHEKALERTLAQTFPEIAFLPVGDALNQLASVLGQLGMAVTMVGLLAVINGLLVLAGTMAAGRKQREADAVVQKVLGATRRDVLWVFVLEYGLLAIFATLIAALVGIAGAWAITAIALGIGFAPAPLLIGAVVAGAVLMTTAAGAATTWRALGTAPATYLRSA